MDLRLLRDSLVHIFQMLFFCAAAFCIFVVSWSVYRTGSPYPGKPTTCAAPVHETNIGQFMDLSGRKVR